MTIIEMVNPSLKSSLRERETFFETWPQIISILENVDVVKNIFFGWMITENGFNVENDFRATLFIEWESKSAFLGFIQSDVFKPFVATLTPLLSSPNSPQLFEMSKKPDLALNAFADVFRIEFDSDESLASARSSWKVLSAAVAKVLNENEAGLLSGPNLKVLEDQNVLLGVICWKDLEIRETAFGAINVVAAKKQLESAHKMNHHLAKYAHQKSH